MEEKNKGGAPTGNKNAEKAINWEYVSNLASIGCTGIEIAEVLGVNADTLTNRCKKEHEMLFSEFIKKGSAKFKVSLRRAMYNRGMSSESDTMLIWLSKNFLGMTDNIKILEEEKSLKSDEELDNMLNEILLDK